MSNVAQSQVLKSLANKMYKVEMEEYENGKTEDKPKPLAKEVKQTKAEKKEVSDKKIDDSLKKMVQGFFRGKKSGSPAFITGMDARKPKLRGDCSKGKSKKSKKAII